MNKVYTVKLRSHNNSKVLFIVFCILFFLAGKLFIPKGGLQNISLACIFTFFVFLTGYLLWEKFAMGRTEWIIKDTGISINWSKKFVLPEKDFDLIWNNIQDISKNHYRGVDVLQIKLITGETIKFYYNTPTKTKPFKNQLYSRKFTLYLFITF